uniref:16S rRNA (cytosine(967)-C(5))-methyltransferase RsmB n=1 Tax=uncultured Allobacillus sp. TaxID=1638025 RepID=UPI002597B22B|nr:16S rRNA (cytosine(967)-C(5))-methyltransferase RsmB [uncultured Allobacillus sp.]
MKNAREISLDLLLKVGDQGGFSHLLINQAIQKNQLSQEDKNLMTELVYGSLQRKITLEYFINHFTKNKKTDSWVSWLLILSFYQMIYLDRVPDHAVINEAVKISKKRGHKGISGFVNGVLRNLQRQGPPDFKNIQDRVKKLSIQTSHPTWLVKRWIDSYGYDITEQMCWSNIDRKNVAVRVHPLRTTRDNALSVLSEENIEATPSSLSEQGLVIDSGNILNSHLFPDQVTIQDETSMLVSEMVNPSPGMTVLDACSAPGGKTTHMAEKMNNEGVIYAYDLHDKKIKLVEERARQLGLSIIETEALDSRQLPNRFESFSFDRILLDAPCSGLGVLRSKPDIKYAKKEEDILSLAKIQKELLQAVLPLLKQDGKLVYSTCTVDRKENDELIAQVMEETDEFEIDQTFFDELPDSCKDLSGLTPFGLQLFPHDFAADGFFITRIKRKK